MAKTITESKDFAQVIASTQEALARGGIATADFDRVYISAVEPAVSITLLPLQAANLAAEAQHRATTGTVTVTRLGEMLKELGYPFSDNASPGEQLVKFLSVWIQGAQQEPNDPHSFTPLFLAEMAKRQVPPINLEEGNASPDLVFWTLLELELFTAAFDRVAEKESRSPNTPRAYPASFTQSLQNAWAENVQLPDCDHLKKQISGFWGQLSGVILKETFSEALKRTIKDLKGEISYSEFKQTYEVAKIINKLIGLITLYRSVNLEVRVVGDDTVHKPAPTESELNKEFEAIVTVTDPDDERDTKIKSDKTVNCLKLLGIPVPDTYEDIAAKLDKWRVEWRLLKGFPEHVQINYAASKFDSEPQLQHVLERLDDTSGKARMSVQIFEERVPDHQGEEKTAEVVIKADLETSEMTKLETLASSIKAGLTEGVSWLGLAGPIVDVVAGFIQEMAPPKAFAVLEVTYHEPAQFLLEGTYSHTGSDGDVTLAWNAPFSIRLEPIGTTATGDTMLHGSGIGEFTLAGHDKYGACSDTTTGTLEWRADGTLANKTIRLVLKSRVKQVGGLCGGGGGGEEESDFLRAELEFPALDRQVIHREGDELGQCFVQNCTTTLDFQVIVVPPKSR